MAKPIARDAMYRTGVFDSEVIELCVRRYITYCLSYSDLVDIMAVRGILVAHHNDPRWSLGMSPSTRSAGTALPSFDSWPMALSVPRSRQTRQDGRLPAAS